jgi:hypothetical protein
VFLISQQKVDPYKTISGTLSIAIQ